LTIKKLLVFSSLYQEWFYIQWMHN
jgi:hypothetical protein